MEVVAIQKVEDGQVERAVRGAVAHVGGLAKHVTPGARVLVKPNLVCARDWRTGTTTNPAVVESIVRLAWKAGAGDVLVGDGSGVGEDTNQVFEALGYNEMALRSGARLVDFNVDPVEVECPAGVVLERVPVSKTVLGVDVLIDVPVLKTHCQTIVTLSLKNMKGVVHPRGKREMHFQGLEQAIVDLSTVIAPQLVVVDGMVGQEGRGPAAGQPVEMNLILAGANRVAVDAVCCRVMGVDPEAIPVIRMASSAGLGPMTSEEITVKGESVASVQRPFQLPVFELSPCEGVDVYGGTACSGCTSQVALVLRDLEDSGELPEIIKAIRQLNIVYGRDAGVPDAQSEGAWLFLGKCQRCVRNQGTWVPGCPAHVAIIKDALRQLAGLPTQTPAWSAANRQ